MIWSHPLFLESVRLLMMKAEFELVGSTSNREESQAQIEVMTPDVVIIEQADGEEQTSVETISILNSGARVVRLSMDDNEISLYSREHRTAVHAEDLAGLILGDAARDTSGSRDD